MHDYTISIKPKPSYKHKFVSRIKTPRLTPFPTKTTTIKQNMDYSNYAEEMEEFRENLTLGLVSALGESKHFKSVQNDILIMPYFAENIPGVQDVVLADHQPCDNIAITSWEQRYSTVLPHEIKDFYLASDGFRLTWSFALAGNHYTYLL